MAKEYNNPITSVSDAVMMTIIDGKLKLLVVTRQRDPYNGQVTLPGTYIREGESSKVSVIRALKEKAGVSDIYVEQLYTFDELGRDPRGQYFSVVYLALSHTDDIKLNISDETQNPQFVDIGTKLAFDHNKIVEYAINRLRSKLEYTTVAKSLLPDTFTLSDLQNIYEVVIGQEMDKRNFRKKFLSLDLLELTGGLRSGLRQRPAQLYRFKSNKVVEIPRWF
jgi:8-oxo-dGTP diphosphatase